jgi:hypothetical protein
MPLYVFLHNLSNILVQIANKIGLQEIIVSLYIISFHNFKPQEIFKNAWNLFVFIIIY